jgi:DNA-binding LacI/PurR family transcriptional regulator
MREWCGNLRVEITPRQAMQNGNAGIKDIAKALKISIGTVDRALHGRPGVSAKTKTRVLQMAEQLGYKPNLAAQALKLNRRLSIGAVLPIRCAPAFVLRRPPLLECR